jgi:hypothetical protein
VHGRAILPGDPLCDPSQFFRVVSSFLSWLKKETKLKPIWMLCGPEMEEVLGERFGWKTLSCVAEERVDTAKNVADHDTEVQRKIRRAQNEGVKVTDIDWKEPVPEALKARANERVKDWLANRKGTQIHLSNIDLFRDERHRRYFIAEDKEGKLVGIAVIAMLAPRHGWQAKYSLDFPDAPVCLSCQTEMNDSCAWLATDSFLVRNYRVSHDACHFRCEQRWHQDVDVRWRSSCPSHARPPPKWHQGQDAASSLRQHHEAVPSQPEERVQGEDGSGGGSYLDLLS